MNYFIYFILENHDYYKMCACWILPSPQTMESHWPLILISYSLLVFIGLASHPNIIKHLFLQSNNVIERMKVSSDIEAKYCTSCNLCSLSGCCCGIVCLHILSTFYHSPWVYGGQLGYCGTGRELLIIKLDNDIYMKEDDT